MEWLRLGLFQSFHLTIKYQLWKANVVANALSRSLRENVEDSTDNLAIMIAVVIEEVVMVLSGESMELIIEDLEKWTTTYKEDQSQVVVYTELC